MSNARYHAVAALLVAVLFLPTLIPGVTQQQRDSLQVPPPSRRPSPSPTNDAPNREFTFVRLVYDSPHSPYQYTFGGAWSIDFPEADQHCVEHTREWAGTNLRVSSRPIHLRATDERLFPYPLADIVKPGHMQLFTGAAPS